MKKQIVILDKENSMNQLKFIRDTEKEIGNPTFHTFIEIYNSKYVLLESWDLLLSMTKGDLDYYLKSIFIKYNPSDYKFIKTFRAFKIILY